MRKIFLFIFIIFIFLNIAHAQTINECKTDIYFGNGIWNSAEQAKEGQKFLNLQIDLAIIDGDPQLKAKYGEVKLQYNWNQGTMLDVLETYYQLKASGQIDDALFFTLMNELFKKNPVVKMGAVALNAFMATFTSGWEEGNVNEMWDKYYEESFKLSHKVLLISHSQGNLFANRVHDIIAPTQYQNYFANLQVASPASSIKAQKGDYVTLSTDLGSFDPVINIIPGSMNPNVSGESGHEFISAYLSQIDPYTNIVTKTKQLLLDLDSVDTQWQTDQEFDKNTKDYRITVKHRFDPNIITMDGEEVFPFAPSKKLYYVNGVDTSGYVKASCGGTKILDADIDTWDNQKDDEIYYLEGTGEKITISKDCLDTQYFDLETGMCKNYTSYRYIYTGAIEVKAKATQVNYHYEGGRILDGRYKGGYIVYDNESYIEASDTGTYSVSLNSPLLVNSEGRYYCGNENPAGSYLLGFSKVIFDNNTFKTIYGYTQVGGGTYQECHLGPLWQLGEYFDNGNWHITYKNKNPRANGGVGYEIFINSYEVIRYGVKEGIK